MLHVYMFKNKIMSCVMNVSYFIPFFVPLDAVRSFIDDFKEHIDTFYEVSEFCLENHVLC